MLQGKFIGVRNVNTFEVRKRFSALRTKKATVSCTALGLFVIEINGKRVGKSYLMPGWTDYDNCVQLARFDITEYLSDGENEIVITVNEGWYKGPLSWARIVNHYGDVCAVCAELCIDGNIITTGLDWKAYTSHIVASGIYDGENVDLTAPQKELKLTEVQFDKNKIIEQICPFVETTDTIKPVSVTESENGFLYDFGQNFAGVVKLEFPKNFCGTAVMKYGEILQNGKLYTENLGSAKATDTFTVNGGGTFCPEFTYHGFRYMEISGVDEPISAIGCVRHTPMVRTGNIVTSNARINKLISNIVWGQRSNFVDVPTDCPQRAERLGWTGDINVFCTTAAYNYDIRSFMRKWLHDVRAEQNAEGEIPLVVPHVKNNELKEKNTAAVWSDVLISVPYTLYKIYGDSSFIKDNYASMKRLVDCRIKRAHGGLIADGYELGDWLALDGDRLKQGNAEGGTDKYFIANAFQSYALEIICKCAKILGNVEDAEKYGAEKTKIVSKMRNEYFTKSGRFFSDKLTAQALALHFNIVPEAHRARLASELNENVIAYGYRVATGFAGTPYLLFALSDNGYHDTACRVLLNNGYPGWLYEVDMGATTVWERWNSLLPDGTPNPDGMNSYNHYAYGSVMEFIYRRIIGFEPLKNGFRSFRFAPHPCKGIAEINAEYCTDKGIIKAGYRYQSGKITYFVDAPKGYLAHISLPDMEDRTVRGNFEYTCDYENLDTLPFDLESKFFEIFGNPKADKAFKDIYKLHPMIYAYLENGRESVAFLRNYLSEKNMMTNEEFDKKFDDFNRRFSEDK